MPHTNPSIPPAAFYNTYNYYFMIPRNTFNLEDIIKTHGTMQNNKFNYLVM